MAREETRGERGPGAQVDPGAAVAGISAVAAGQAAAENFPVALRLLPGRYRQHLAAVYAFARSADDLGDEAPPRQRLALLDELEADLRRLYAAPEASPGGGGAELAVVRGLAPAVSGCAIPLQLFLDLIEANRQDQVVTSYPDFTALLRYCRLSANPVGRIVLHVFGVVTPRRQALSDDVCTALQVVEHLQDVAEDFRAGRVYLPAEDMARFGCTTADLAAAVASRPLRDVIEFEAGRAAGLLDSGAVLAGTLRGAARLAVAGYVAGGRAALAAIRAHGHDVMSATPRPARARLAAELLRCYARGR